MSQEQLIHASGSSGASPGESPYLNRITWASYKGLSRGQLGGLVLGGLIGLGVGAVTAALTAAFLPAAAIPGGIGMGTLTTAIVAGGAAIGAKYYYDIFKHVGSTSGAVAAGMEINEERSQVMNIKLDTILNVLAKDGKISPEEIKTIEDDVESVYRKGAKDFEKKFQDKPAYFWQIGAIGALAGVALLAAMGGVGYAVSLFTGHAADVLGFAGSHMGEIGIATAGSALAGASYGINRNYYRNVLNVTNALFEGNLAEIEMQRARQRGLVPEMELPDFTPISKPVPAHMNTPGTIVSQPQATAQMHASPVVMAEANNLAFSRWQELERARAEAALGENQRPTLH